MKVEPLKLRPLRQHALLYPGNRELVVETRWGATRYTGRRKVEGALAQLKGLACYVSGPLQALKHTTGAMSWTMETWKNREVAMIHGPTGTRVMGLRRTLAQSADPFADLTQALDWLAQYGVAPASLSSMAWQLFRASLSQSLSIGVDPEISRAALFGGRQSCKEPKCYKQQKLVDIKAAYPSQMASRPYPLSIERVPVTTSLDPDYAGFARAQVWVPHDLPFAPLPVRLGPEAIQFQWGSVEGVYTWRELYAAAELGCKVVVGECWAPRREVDLFTNWWTMAQTGRELQGAAANITKAITVCTWGQFAMDGQGRGRVHFMDEEGTRSFLELEERRPMPHVWLSHIAAETTARVRTQTLLEGLYGMGHTRPCHVDTDGVIAPRNAPMPKNTGPGFGQWRVKDTMYEVEIRGPQFYRWACHYCGLEHAKWHYCASGMTESQAAVAFKRTHFATRISYLSRDDVVLPSLSSFDHDRITELLKEAQCLGLPNASLERTPT